MLVVFDSKTGNNKRFVEKLGIDSIGIEPDLIIQTPYVLITYTTGFGEAPITTMEFLKLNHSYLKGIAASGNKAWGDNFARSAEVISKMYNVPILHRWEMSGMPEDVEIFKERVQKISYETH